MFKRLSRNLFDKEIDSPPSIYDDLAHRPTNPFSTDLMNALEPHSYEVAEEAREEEPETIIT